MREVPLTGRALAALDRLPRRLDTPLLFPAPAGDELDLDNFRRRELAPAVEASGVARTRHYGTLIDGTHAGIAERLDAFEGALEQANTTPQEAQP